MTEQERGLIERFFEEVWNRRRREAIAEMLAPDTVIHDSGVDSVGPAGFYTFFDRMHGTFSDFEITIHDTLAEGDTVCVRWSFTGKHTGDGLGLPATGATVRTTGMTMVRVAENRIVEGWQNWDMLGLMRQMESAPQVSATYIGA